MHEAPYGFARALIRVGGARREFVGGAVDVGVLVFIEIR